MYLCALALTRSDDPEFFISTAFFEDQYGISRSSRKRGLAELMQREVLTVRVEETVDARTFRRVRRNIYRLTKRYRLPEPWTGAEAEGTKSPPEKQEEAVKANLPGATK